MLNFLLIPFAMQGTLMFFDEFYFHRKRGLPLWERIGHPLDSLTVLACYVFIYFAPFSERNIWIYVGLCIFSCVFVTKDEFVHQSRCQASENWLHAMLFILHPVTFLSAGILWKNNVSIELIEFQSIVIFMFMMYQIIYWSSVEAKPRKS